MQLIALTPTSHLLQKHPTTPTFAHLCVCRQAMGLRVTGPERPLRADGPRAQGAPGGAQKKGSFKVHFTLAFATQGCISRRGTRCKIVGLRFASCLPFWECCCPSRFFPGWRGSTRRPPFPGFHRCCMGTKEAHKTYCCNNPGHVR